MSKPSYDLAVAYRIYPKISHRPLVFRDNKYQLAKLCLESFKEALGSLKAKIWVLLDGCPPEYGELFKQHFNAEDLELIHLDGIGNLATFYRQIDILSKQPFAEIVYFAEDDYFYLPDQFEHAVKFLLANKDVDFVSLYDHSDYYASDLHQHQNFIRIFDSRHWRTANSTCLTFLTTKAMLQKNQSIFRSYTRKNYDASLWLSLTKHKLFNPVLPVKYLRRDRMLSKVLLKSWLYGWKQNLFGKKRNLWVPIPAMATHMESTCLAPAINWPAVIKQKLNSSKVKKGDL